LALRAPVDARIGELGGIDIVVANAGSAAVGEESELKEAFQDVVAGNLTGTWNTVRASRSTMIGQDRGGSIILTSSTAGLKGVGGSSAAARATPPPNMAWSGDAQLRNQPRAPPHSHQHRAPHRRANADGREPGDLGLAGAASRLVRNPEQPAADRHPGISVYQRRRVVARVGRVALRHRRRTTRRRRLHHQVSCRSGTLTRWTRRRCNSEARHPPQPQLIVSSSSPPARRYSG
jgi:hypothetical protein